MSLPLAGLVQQHVPEAFAILDFNLLVFCISAAHSNSISRLALAFPDAWSWGVNFGTLPLGQSLVLQCADCAKLAHRGELACDNVAAAFAGVSAPAETGRGADLGGDAASWDGSDLTGADEGGDGLAVAGAAGPATVPVGGMAGVTFGESAFEAVFGVASGDANAPATAGPFGGEAFAGESAFCTGVSGLAGGTPGTGPVGGEAFAGESAFGAGVSGLTVGGTPAGPVGCEAFAAESESCIGCDETGAAEGGDVLVIGGEFVESAPAVLGAVLVGGEAFGRSGEAGDALAVGARTAVPAELRVLDVAGAALGR
ncbi:unnamed protein product [Symbiodinium sp. CCMP2592]|nr:unnamed protein product [Symbiodinium sp. CCMP2592]